MAPTTWQAPRLWPGETVVVAASGPSLTQQQLELVRGRCRVIAVNDAYRLAPWADVLYAADHKWWAHHFPLLNGTTSLLVTAQKDPPPVSERINLIGHDADGSRSRFDNPGYLRGANSGAEALHLAWHMAGGPLILLLGCDCRDDGRKTHFFGDHPPALRTGSNYANFAQHFANIGKELTARGVRVVNCSPISALTCFEKARLEDVLPPAELPMGDEWRIHERA